MLVIKKKKKEKLTGVVCLNYTAEIQTFYATWAQKFIQKHRIPIYLYAIILYTACGFFVLVSVAILFLIIFMHTSTGRKSG